MQIAIIGAGNIGATLGAKWAGAGHKVIFGARDPQSAKVQTALRQVGAGAGAASIEQALAEAAVVLLALPGSAVADFAARHGEALHGKLVIDATNQFALPVMNGLATLQAAAPGATLARAFNSLGWENFAEPLLGGVQADMLYCAPPQANTTLDALISAVGLRPLRVGDLAQAALIDNLGALWGALAFGQGHGRRVAFKVLLPDGT